MESYKINNVFTTPNYFTDGSLINTIEPSKFISIPINLSFNNNGNEDILKDIIQEEINSNVNPFIDLETFKFNSSQYGTSIPTTPTINFYLADSNNNYYHSYY